MKKKRLIPILLLRNGWLVQSKNFHEFKNLGNPVTSVKRMSEWASDEIIYLDISRENLYDLRRDDIKNPNRHGILEIIEDISKMAFMPLTVGGGIRSLQDIEDRLKRGADKVAINTKALESKDFITKSAHEFGSQCVVVSADYKYINKKPVVFSSCGQKTTKYSPLEWVKIAESLGAGEILINSIDRDGQQNGYDIELISQVANSVKIPIIACGGVGKWEHFKEALENTNVDAVAAANIFQFSDQSVYLAKKYLYNQGFKVRPPDLLII